MINIIIIAATVSFVPSFLSSLLPWRPFFFLIPSNSAISTSFHFLTFLLCVTILPSFLLSLPSFLPSFPFLFPSFLFFLLFLSYSRPSFLLFFLPSFLFFSFFSFFFFLIPKVFSSVPIQEIAVENGRAVGVKVIGDLTGYATFLTALLHICQLFSLLFLSS